MRLIEDGPAHLIDMHFLHLLRTDRAQLRTHSGLVLIFINLSTPVVDLQSHLVVLADDVIEHHRHFLQIVADFIGGNAHHVLAVGHQQQVQLLAESDEGFQIIAVYDFVLVILFESSDLRPDGLFFVQDSLVYEWLGEGTGWRLHLLFYFDYYTAQTYGSINEPVNLLKTSMQPYY